MTEKTQKTSTFEAIKSMGSILIWAVGLIFAAGMAYTKLNDTEKKTNDQAKDISVIKENQSKSLDALTRIEESNKKTQEMIYDDIRKNRSEIAILRQDMSDLEKKVTRNEYDLERLKEEK